MSELGVPLTTKPNVHTEGFLYAMYVKLLRRIGKDDVILFMD